jgi:hypothetical protein
MDLFALQFYFIITTIFISQQYIQFLNLLRCYSELKKKEKKKKEGKELSEI